MELIRILKKKSNYFYFFLIALSLLNGLLNTGLLMFINQTINKEFRTSFMYYDWYVYVALIVTCLVSNKIFQTYMIRLTNDILFDFELSILKKIQLSKFESFEKLGSERVFTAINDTRVLSNVPEIFMNAMNSLLIVMSCFAYIFWISTVGGLFILGLMAALLVFYLYRNQAIEKELNIFRDLQDKYYKYLNDLLHGFKEIKISSNRGFTIYNKFIEQNILSGKRIRISTSIRYMYNELTGNYSWFIVLGSIMFLLPRFADLNSDQVTAFIVTILYLIGPVAVLITLVPVYTNVKIALRRLDRFDAITGIRLTNEAEQVDTTLDGAFVSLRFVDVTFEYYDEENEKTFRVGPINAEIARGEVVFITGGNGSGKSTFINILTGLYVPTSGTIFYNDFEILPENYASYRDNFTAIFTNTYLFNENYDEFDLNESNAELREYVKLMKLNEVIRFKNDSEFLDTKLSKGQQKRMALILALLEDKPIMVLDEWAAEQDPGFRKYFYETLLTRFKNEGKTIVAVTHDEAFFHCSDRVMKFDYGQIVSDRPTVEVFSETGSATI